jgi:hypothetical protein
MSGAWQSRLSARNRFFGSPLYQGGIDAKREQTDQTDAQRFERGIVRSASGRTVSPLWDRTGVRIGGPERLSKLLGHCLRSGKAVSRETVVPAAHSIRARRSVLLPSRCAKRPAIEVRGGFRLSSNGRATLARLRVRFCIMGVVTKNGGS